MDIVEATKEAEHSFLKGLNAAWEALKILNDHDYDIDFWLDQCSPKEAINEADRILVEEAEKTKEESEKYGARITFEEAWCEKPPDIFVNPLEKRMECKILKRTKKSIEPDEKDGEEVINANEH